MKRVVGKAALAGLAVVALLGAALVATAAPASAGLPPCPDTQMDVGTAEEYRDALACATAGSQTRVVRLTANIFLDSSIIPLFADDEELIVNGRGFLLDGGTETRALDRTTPGPTLFIDIVVANGSGDEGGAVRSAGDVTVLRSVFRDNAATAIGGAIFPNTGNVTVENSTFARNSAGSFGGGIYTNGTIDIRNSTFDRSNVLSAGATTLGHATMIVSQARSNVSVTSFGSVLDSDGTACFAPTKTSLGYNLVTDDTCGFAETGDVEDGTPVLGPLRNNGLPPIPGATVVRPTMFPLNGSPLVDAIPVDDCSDVIIPGDARGIPRPFGAGCDIGATEAVFPPHGFSDVTPFYEATVRWITSAINEPNILDGYDDGTFRQTLDITRGQIARMYHRARGFTDEDLIASEHPFTDVTPFFEAAVRYNWFNGIFAGFDDDTFRQANPITRGNYIRSLYIFAGSPDVSTLDPQPFGDVTPFYEDAVRWAAHHGLADGFDDNTFRQKLNITRGNATRILYNLARSPDAWFPPGGGPFSTLFTSNLGM